MIRFYLKIQEKFVHLLFQNGFWFVNILSVRMTTFTLLAQFPVDQLLHPVMSSLILFLLIIWVIVSSLSSHILHLIYFKQFSLAWVHTLIVKNISISSCSFHSNSSNLANPVQYKYRYYSPTVKCQNSSISNNSVYRKYSFNFKNSSISNYSV